ncbi:DNA-directed RNA polymerase I subunit RPA49 [Trichonephila inaurata madagascariensis]|uniref:DNA-directed RNA polymerase I subunit RPA49 n=1 Tax=Trichonephila inaurata madagascariensis TaxID=2747483 RepID=A0A8X6XE57_9ARAC|nr:DNA-directed RNA polymerase I subunit RPA49 [Trichonephila inaurata madagascariensis]
MLHDSFLENEMDDNDRCKIRIYSKRYKRVPVFITNFSHGELNTNSDKPPKFECFKKADDDKIGCDAERKLIANNGRLNYIGLSDTPLLKPFVGVRSKSTGKIKLFDSVLFRMKPDVKKDACDIQLNNTPDTYWENLNNLTKSFGIKGRKRAMETAMKCAVDKSEKESLTFKDLPQLSTPDISLPDNSQQNIDYLPPQNRDASCVEDVFDINCIISPEEDASLTVEVENLLAAPPDVMKERKLSFCIYAREHFDSASAIKAKYLLYYDYLIKFHKLKFTDIRRKDPAPHIPEPYKQNMLSQFTSLTTNEKGKETRNLPTTMKDKLVSYIFVLALFIDDFKVNINQMSNDLNLNLKKLTMIAQALGCHLSTKKWAEVVVKYAELKLPLFVFMPKYVKKVSRK